LNGPDHIGIFGGTFDPIHFGHLMAAWYASQECNLKKVLIIPAGTPPHKEAENVLDDQHRLNMVKLATKDEPVFSLSTLEIDRQGYSYTIDTVQYYLKKYPEKRLHLIVGADCIHSLHTWKDARLLVQLCSFIAVVRPGYELKQGIICNSWLPTDFWNKLKIVNIPGVDISSSMIRERIKQGKTVKYLLPDAVEKYIMRHRLYRNTGEEDD